MAWKPGWGGLDRRGGDDHVFFSFSEVILNKKTLGILQISLNNRIVFMYSFK